MVATVVLRVYGELGHFVDRDRAGLLEVSIGAPRSVKDVVESADLAHVQDPNAQAHLGGVAPCSIRWAGVHPRSARAASTDFTNRCVASAPPPPCNIEGVGPQSSALAPKSSTSRSRS